VVDDQLLAGPRGRRLCAAVAALVDERVTRLLTLAVWSPADAAARSSLLSALAGIDASTVGQLSDETALLASLADAVTFAMYWQEPDDTDRLLARDEFRAALAPVAQALTGAPAAAWWSTGIQLDAQHHVGWLYEDRPTAPALHGAADSLRQWRAATLADERKAFRRPVELTAPNSGWWWSAPLGRAQLVSTSRAIGSLDAVALLLVEDSLGWTDAQVWPVTPEPGCRVFEITDENAWTSLAERYPLEVTRSRRHDWWRATGHPGPWHIPDWAQMSADFDAVHLTVLGYLATAGRALDLGDGATLIAGWNPDQTFWLTDVLSTAGSPRSWHRDDGNATWALQAS
jgi:hypothetical protein